MEKENYNQKKILYQIEKLRNKKRQLKEKRNKIILIIMLIILLSLTIWTILK